MARVRRLVPPLDVRSGAFDGLVAVVASLTAFAVYWFTLLPDVGGPEDTPKFQYLGAVLGIAHQPGYPLHALLSFAFSKLPLGTVAWRANLLSAACGAVAVAFAFMLARATGSRRAAAWLAALTLAFGERFWRYSVLAEVYTLAAVLLLGVALGLVRWWQTGRDRYLYAASVCFGLSLGNQLSVVAAVPAIVLFLIVTNLRRVLEPRVFLTAATIVISGFLQYAYVLVRTRQRVRYREASASSVADLIPVILADNYSGFVFAFGWTQFLTERLPEFARLVRAEVGAVGLVLAAIGLPLLMKRDWRVGMFILAAFIGIAVFITNLNGDLPGFLVMPIGLLAPVVAAGTEVLVRGAERLTGRRVAGVLALLAVAYPILPLRANHAANDWHARTEDARFFRQLFSRLPPDATFLPEDYTTDSIVEYFLAAERHDRAGGFVQPRADRESVTRLLGASMPVIGFDATYARLAPRGVAFSEIDLPGAAGPRHAYQLEGVDAAVEFGDATWHDLTPAVRDGRVSLLVDNYRAFDAHLVLYAVSDAPLRPLILPTHRFGRGRPTIDVRRFDRGQPGEHEALASAVAQDKAPADLLQAQGRFATRVEHRVNDVGDYAAWAVTFGALPARVVGWARADRPEGHRAIGASLPARRDAAGEGTLSVGAGGQDDWAFGDGWHAAERDGEGEFRWSAASDARLLIPLVSRRELTVTVRLQGRPSTSVHLLVNGRDAGPCRVAGGWQSCEWRVSADAVGPGASEVVVRSSSLGRPSEEPGVLDDRLLGVAMRGLEVNWGR
jgi:hypothetical protein